MFSPTTVEDVAKFVAESSEVTAVGGGTKFPVDFPRKANLNMASLSGVLEYEPSEYIVTALAGTRISVLNKALAEHHQYLPFDPPLIKSGATLGGTIACGLSGPGRIRFGGLRDFLIGVRFIDGNGQILQGGGKVVKNAAGFDYPKLLCGSKGSLGVIVECTFKVFPKPVESQTLLLTFKDLEQALEALNQIQLSAWEADALELDPINKQILLRISGSPEALESRLPVIRKALLHSASSAQFLPTAESIWQSLNEYAWCPKHHTLFKIPITPKDIPKLEQSLARISEHRRYSMAGNLALIAISRKASAPGPYSAYTPTTMGIAEALDAVQVSEKPIQAFVNMKLDAEPIFGPYFPNPSPPKSNLQPIHERIQRTFDPDAKFPPLRF